MSQWMCSQYYCPAFACIPYTSRGRDPWFRSRLEPHFRRGERRHWISGALTFRLVWPASCKLPSLLWALVFSSSKRFLTKPESYWSCKASIRISYGSSWLRAYHHSLPIPILQVKKWPVKGVISKLSYIVGQGICSAHKILTHTIPQPIRRRVFIPISQKKQLRPEQGEGLARDHTAQSPPQQLAGRDHTGHLAVTD